MILDTLNSDDDKVATKENGIYGIYADYLLPRDWQTYPAISK